MPADERSGSAAIEDALKRLTKPKPKAVTKKAKAKKARR